MVKSDYKVCPKCGVRHSTLVRHRCLKPPGQKEKPKFDNPEGEPGNDGGQGGGPEGPETDGQGQPEKGEGQGDGEGGEGEAGEGEGEGEDGSGQGEGEGEGKGQGEGSGQAEDEIPPAAVVVTVLKFGALTAMPRGIMISLSPDGLVLTGAKGGKVHRRVLDWGEVEKRATIDGEYYLKEQIDEVAKEMKG